MIIADFLKYKPLKEIPQKGPTCSAHSFFVHLSECIQQKYGIDVEFDIYKYYDEMEKYRNLNKLPSGKKWTKTTAFLRMASRQGFRTTDGRRAFVDGWSQLHKDKTSFWKLCWMLQKYGPIQFGLRIYKGHDLNPKNYDTIKPVPEGAKTDSSHLMIITGFDFRESSIEFQNSWNNNNIKKMPFSVFEQVHKYSWAIKDVVLEGATPLYLTDNL